MDKITTQFMDLNRETAMRLWNKQFGKETKVKDFAGREIAKGAYNDRGSKFGWNVDHILPQCKNGKTADHNLICCHILTNDEKGSKFPCFVANDRTFEILKVENHYEIKPVKSKAEQKPQQQQPQELNLFDSASGIRFYKKQKGIQNKKCFVGTVIIKLEDVQNTALIDFIEEVFCDESIVSYSNKNSYWNRNDITLIIRNYNMPKKDDINELLDKCVLLHTYLSYYFKELGEVKDYNIFYRVDMFDNKLELCGKVDDIRLTGYRYISPYSISSSCLHINNLVIVNTEANKRVQENPHDDYTEYNIVYTKLSENLKKEVNGK